jgi:hypothetical protein
MFGIMFECPDIVLSRPASRRPSCCGTARTPGSRENLAVEQHAWRRPGRGSALGYLEQCRQLTAARADNPWLAGGSQTVQQQALRDFARAVAGFFARTHGRPSWRKAGRDEGFWVTGRSVTCLQGRGRSG